MNHDNTFIVEDIDPETAAALSAISPAHQFDPVRQGESKKGGWSGFADMVTGQEDVCPGPNATFREAFTHTIRFGMSPPSVGSGAGIDPFENTVHCVADIVSGVEGQWVTRSISICLGAAITVTADSIMVRFRDLSLLTNAATPPGLPYRVTAQITKGFRASYVTPPTLFAFTDIVNSAPVQASGVVALPATTGNARYPIPPNAGVISCEVVATGAAGAAPNILVIAAGGNVDLKQWNPSVNLGFEVLPPSATYVEIQNLSGTVAADVTLTWGIEG